MANHRKPTDYVPRGVGRPLTGEVEELVGEAYCGGCRRMLPKAMFYRKRAAPSGVQSRCKVCHRQHVKETRDREAANEYSVRYKREHREAKNAYARWRAHTSVKEREHRRLYMIAYRERLRRECPDLVRARRRAARCRARQRVVRGV